jgi:alginate O-acetyltransferase complex protein AlgI
MKNVVLLIFSLLFYFLGEPVYTVILLFSTVVDYSHSLIIEKYRGGIQAKIALISSIIINVSILGFFKYYDFLAENLNSILGTNIENLSLALPLGISFFTFQTMSYTIDVYRGEAKAQKNILGLGMYISLFPQLVAGPIVRYKTIADEIGNRVHSLDNFAFGVKRFIIGLAKKVLLANTIGELSQIVNQVPDKSVLLLWMGAIAFALQIYFDFSGYSDMAIGLGRIFGFHFLENFNYPYIARSISEFWRRWHISLGSWFRDYVYIPLGGSKCGQLKTIRNLILVWFLTGLWHGASWNFVIWGLFFGLMIALEKTILGQLLEKAPKLLQHAYVLITIVFSFVIFSHDSIMAGINVLQGMMGLLDIPLVNREALYYLKSYSVMFLVSMIASTPLVYRIYQKLQTHQHYKKILPTIETVGVFALLLFVTGYLVDASFNPFLYFRF